MPECVRPRKDRGVNRAFNEALVAVQIGTGPKSPGTYEAVAERGIRVLKILYSAYSCEPGMGSEPGIGWHWAVESARAGHETWVLTRASNRRHIEPVLDASTPMPNLHFLYYDLPAWARWWKKGTRGLWLYYRLWQWQAYRLAERVHRAERFDQVQHITMGCIRQPSFMGRLGIPFVFGPVGGGESAPWQLRRGFGIRGWLHDGLRDMSNWLVRLDPTMRAAFRRADRIYVTTRQGLGVVPRRYRHKASVQLAIGWDDDASPGYGPSVVAASSDRVRARADGLRFLFVGRLLHWKGLSLGLRAFARVLQDHPGSRLTVVGKGPQERSWRKLAHRLGIADRIDWIPWVARSDVLSLYHDHDALLFPSLHDSGGMVVFEAFAAGLPVVCLDLGGPGVIVDDGCGRVIGTAGRSEVDVVNDLAAAMGELSADPALRARLSAGARRRLASFRWADHVGAVHPAPMPARTIGAVRSAVGT